MADENRNSRLLSLVFTDLADSTALKTARGDEAVHDLIEAHRAHVTRLAAECAGRIIDWAGDGCFLTFETSSAAALFALRLQQAHADNSDLPGVRIGIHMGEVSEGAGPQGPDGPPRIDGLAVDIAARIGSLAKPGQVLMSSAVHDSARQRLGVEAFGQPVLWQTHGTYSLKGFDKPVEISEASLEGFAPLEAPAASEKAKLVQKAKSTAASSSHERPRSTLPIAVLGIVMVIGGIALLGVAALFIYRMGQGASPTPGQPLAISADRAITSLAVLPLDNLSGDPQQEYFSDGMTEAITAELAKIRALKVISRTSVMRYKDTDLSMPEIAAELGVQGLIEGSVLRDGDEVRVTVQLIDGRLDTHIWSESYTAKIISVLKLQSDVALAIAAEIGATLSPEEQELVAATRAVDPEAYENFLLGRHFMDVQTSEALDEAAEYFAKAIEIDPNYAEAWANLSGVYMSQQGWAYSEPREVVPKARAAATRALELDPNLAMAHHALAEIAHNHDWEWEEAERRYERAIELDPNTAELRTRYSWLLAQQGRTEESLAQANVVLDLDPNSFSARSYAAGAYIASGQPEVGASILEDSYRMDPENLDTLDVLNWAYRELGRFEEAIDITEQWIEASDGAPGPRLNLAAIYARVGRVDEARSEIASVLADQDSVYVTPTRLAWAHAELGEIDRALELLEQAFQRRDWFMNWMRIAPGLRVNQNPNGQRIYTDPRYWSIVERMEFPPLPAGHPAYEREQAWLARKAAAEADDAPIRKIAVLPFDNLSSDPEQEYFVDGMTEALIAELAKVESLKVISRTSAMRYKGSDEPLATIARELGVDAIVEGSVLKAGNDVRITAQLIRGATDEHLWASSYTDSLENILKLQSEVALAITREIQSEISTEDDARFADTRIVHPDAYDAYLMGRFYLNRQSEDGYAQAAEYFSQALEIDPNYADAHAGLGSARYGATFWGWGDPREGAQAVREGIRRALELDPDNIAAKRSAALLALNFEYDWEAAETRSLELLALRPDNITARTVLARLDILEGRYEEAILEAELLLDLDPFNPGSRDRLADFYDMAGRHEEALEIRLRTREMTPDHVGTHLNIAESYAILRRYDEAVETIEAVEPLIRNWKMYQSQLAAYLAHAGRVDEARAILEELEYDESDEYLSPFRMAFAWIAVGDIDKTLSYLDLAYEERPTTLWMLGTRWFESLWASIWDDPRFQAFLEKMNFPEREDKN